MRTTKRCPHCNRPTKGTVHGYCSWDCHDHAGDEPERHERHAA
jgi:hypothetical protein